ncbi:hypothetical protein GWI33_004629 [Rhynchophorus ferrugineus]|uniref:Uncharacterized protein n=1 Tax=Rhynchophorus ferrugineus TaxID=354439 RepID=A0A834MP23_RHYFE|nr:hypothetical protein GWI33_004629 [Rhynchophorus ferrugineus]
MTFVVELKLPQQPAPLRFSLGGEVGMLWAEREKTAKMAERPPPPPPPTPMPRRAAPGASFDLRRWGVGSVCEGAGIFRGGGKNGSRVDNNTSFKEGCSKTKA